MQVSRLAWLRTLFPVNCTTYTFAFSWKKKTFLHCLVEMPDHARFCSHVIIQLACCPLLSSPFYCFICICRLYGGQVLFSLTEFARQGGLSVSFTVLPLLRSINWSPGTQCYSYSSKSLQKVVNFSFPNPMIQSYILRKTGMTYTRTRDYSSWCLPTIGLSV